MPPDPTEPFVFLNLLQISSAEKNTLKKMLKLCPPPFFKFLAQPWKSFMASQPWKSFMASQPWKSFMASQPWKSFMASQPWKSFMATLQQNLLIH